MKVWRMGAKIIVAGTDVTNDISKYLRGISYEDNLSGEADTCELELQDVERKFAGNWFPTLSNTLKISFNRESNGVTSTLELGEFEIDEVTFSYAPSLCKIKAVSISQNAGLRQRDESKSWENCRLSEIAQNVASDSGVELFYEASDDPLINRAEQGEQSRMAFLEKLCKDNYLVLKFSDGKLIIYDESKLDSQPAIATFERGNSPIKSFSVRATLQDVYKKCVVSYNHGKQAELFEGEFDSGREKGKVLKINQKVDSQAEAERLARNKLREKNKDEIKVNLTVIGEFELVAGNVIELKGHGVFDGRYLIEKATHKLGSGYDVDLECRRCLTY